ncbi:7tm 6 domain containing protein, partial [Asbolus verrucosus]
MMIAIKTYCLVKNMRKLKKLMITLNSDLFQPKNVEQRNLVQPSLNLWKTIYNFFYFMAVAAIFFWSSFPILDNSVKEHRLPFLAWYPYNFKKSPFYEVTYLYQIVSIGFLAIVNGNIDTLVAALNMYTGTQFDILCDDLRNLQSSDRDALTDMNKRLVNCIMHHREILSLSYGNTVLVQIFMYCWFGNEVEVKSNKVSYAAFESDWTSASQDVKKNLLFFIVRTQKPLKIAAMNMFHLSLENFV